MFFYPSLEFINLLKLPTEYKIKKCKMLQYNAIGAYSGDLYSEIYSPPNRNRRFAYKGTILRWRQK